MSYEKEQVEKPNPLLPFIGFVLLIIIVGVSFWLSPDAVQWVQTTHWKMGGRVEVLPLTFPAEWPFIVNQLVVTLVMSIIMFAIAMSLMFIFMRTSTDEIDVKDLKEFQRSKKKRRGR